MKKRILTPANRKIINEIAEEEGMFPKQIEDIVMAQFEYMKKMKSLLTLKQTLKKL